MSTEEEFELFGIKFTTNNLRRDYEIAKERVRMHLEKGKPQDVMEQYIYGQDLIRFTLMHDAQSEKPDFEQMILLHKLDELVDKAKRIGAGSDHYKIGFISTIAEMTYCIKNPRTEPIVNILAHWLVPAKIRACHNKFMTNDRVEYVLKLAKENGIEVQHF